MTTPSTDFCGWILISMGVDPRDISFVLQGPLSVGWDVRYTARYLRQLFPGCTVILSTQENLAKGFEGAADFDRVVMTADPGSLPSIKMGGDPNNVNRQIDSTRAGLAEVVTPFAAKLRTDAYLASRRIAEIWSEFGEASLGSRCVGHSRILVSSFYSLNPRFDERLAYHISDWVQFGRTEDLQRFWSCPHFNLPTATWYERQPFLPGSLRRETEFRSRYGTEQWLTLHYLYGEEFPIKVHNEISEEIVENFEECIADNFIILHPSDFDLQMPKHLALYRNRYFGAICYSFDDWRKLVEERRQIITELRGFSIWPHDEVWKRRYVSARNRLRLLRHFPLGRVRGWVS